MAKFIVVCGIRIATEFEAKTHGRLTAIGHAFVVGKKSKQVFECDCGEVVVASLENVNRKHTTSCGCYRRQAMTKHGFSGHPLYRTWVDMIQRCYDPNFNQYIDYGGRGVTVCDRWRESFANFLSDMGERPKGCSIDRIDNNKGYCPENCRWATRVQQQNNRRNNRWITIDGKTQTIGQWANETGVRRQTIYRRLNSGLTSREAVFGKPN